MFKVVSGIPGRPATIWDMSVSTYEFSLAALNVNNSFQHHYKNRIVQNWSEFKPVEVCAYIATTLLHCLVEAILKHVWEIRFNENHYV